MSKILITGSSGLLGSACVELFEKKGWEVVGADNNARSKNLGTPTKAIEREVDLTDAQQVFQLFLEHQFGAIIHTAAQASHDFSNENVLLDFDTNARATALLLEAARNYCPDASFVYVSTDKVYGENMHVPLKEEETRYSPILKDFLFDETLGLDTAGHRSPFGCSKAAGDMYAQEYAATFGMKTGIFRPGCITGKNHEGAELHGFLAYLAKCIREGSPYRIFGFKGKQVRDQIHASDLANAFWHFIQDPKPGEVYNIGGGIDRSVSVLEAVEKFEEISGKTCDYSFYEPRPGDRCWDVHSVSKFKSHYPDWDYSYSLEDIIKDVYVGV